VFMFYPARMGVAVPYRGLLPRRALQVLCAGSRGLLLSPGIKWSAWNGSSGRGPLLHMWQMVAVSLTNFALRL
jgi:hypothetical protein